MVSTLVAAIVELKHRAAVDPSPSTLHMLAEVEELLRRELYLRGRLLAGLRA